VLVYNGKFDEARILASAIVSKWPDDENGPTVLARLAEEHGETQTAIAALDAASNLMRQLRADVLKKLLPPPPAGWTADPAASSPCSGSLIAICFCAGRTARKWESVRR